MAPTYVRSRYKACFRAIILMDISVCNKLSGYIHKDETKTLYAETTAFITKAIMATTAVNVNGNDKDSIVFFEIVRDHKVMMIMAASISISISIQTTIWGPHFL